MAIVELDGQPWTRKHDQPGVAVVPSAPRTLYPQTLEDLIKICQTRAPAERIRAAGSHWALSEAAISDNVFVETHDPANLQQAMGKTLYDIVPPCLSQPFVDQLVNIRVAPFDKSHVNVNEGLYPIHIETGKRIYQLYAELDAGDDDPRSLAVSLANPPEGQTKNDTYLGPWAFRTLGGAGGQTVFGALTTGTHGGDFNMGPVSDSVLAMHLVADGGQHFWIEPASGVPGFEANLTDETKVRAFYGDMKFGGPDNFQYIRDDDLFNAVLISAGRFGIVYSVVIAGVRQYSLREKREMSTWSAVRKQIAAPVDASSGFWAGAEGKDRPNRFMQIAVCVTPHVAFTENLVGITRRWNVPLAPIPGSESVPAGRAERVGDRLEFDQLIQARRFTKAGNSFAYSPSDQAGKAGDPTFLEKACTDGNFLAGVVDQVREELQNFVDSNGDIIGPTLLAVTAAGGGGLVLGLIAAFILILAFLALLAAAIRASGNKRFGEVMNDVRGELLNNPDPAARAAGLITWQMIVFLAFKAQQGEQDYSAISYAVMDGHEYFDRSCFLNVQSIEVFFDATDGMLTAFVDQVLAFEVQQEIVAGRAFAGYVSLRFTAQGNALIAPERFPLTCAVEIAGLADVDGSTELIDFAIRTALNLNVHAILHWGQRNESRRADIEERFGDSPTNPTGSLHTWRAQLARITDNGRLEGFSTDFTRRTGLEIVTPVITSLTAVGAIVLNPIPIDWEATHNPPATQVRVEVVTPDGTLSTFTGQPLSGHRDFPTTQVGNHTVTVVASLTVDGTTNETRQSVTVQVLQQPIR